MVAEGAIAGAVITGVATDTSSARRNLINSKSVSDTTTSAADLLKPATKEMMDAFMEKQKEMGINVNVNVQVADGLSAKVTSEAKKTSKAAISGTRQNKRAGQN